MDQTIIYQSIRK
jgi:hypothetical protein